MCFLHKSYKVYHPIRTCENVRSGYVYSTQFTHAPFTISNEFTTVCWVCYTLILDAFPPVHNISKSETHFNIFEQYNKGNISTQHIFFRECFTSFYILIIMIITSILQGSGFSPQNLLIEGEICDLSLRQLRGERLRLVPLVESHFCNRATFVLHEKKKREIRQNLQYINIYMSFQEMFCFWRKNGICYKGWCNFPLGKPVRIATSFLHLALGKLASPEKYWGCRSRSSPLCCLWLWTVCCLTILLASKDVAKVAVKVWIRCQRWEPAHAVTSN